MKNSDGTLAWLRDRNRHRVMEILRMQSQVSQADLARATGLSRTTVSSLIAELKDAGLVLDAEPTPRQARGGRPGVQLVLQDPSLVVAGIDFGHSHVGVAISDLAHHLLAERRYELDVNRQAVQALDAAARMFAEVLSRAGMDRRSVLRAGIGIPGPVDRARGTAGSSTILPGWVGLSIASEMGERLGVPVEIENDANLGALAELTWGAGRDCSNFAYVKAATGIGAGIVIEGRLLHGVTGTAGEIGHTSLQEAGDICRCGSRGCLETHASGAAIAALLSRSLAETLTLEDVLARAVDGDPGCRRALADAGRHIGAAVADLCNLINPERIVVGGSMAVAGDVLLDPLREAVGLRAIPSAAEDVEIVPGELGARAELLGAVALVLHEAGPAWSGPAPAVRQSTATT